MVKVNKKIIIFTFFSIFLATFFAFKTTLEYSARLLPASVVPKANAKLKNEDEMKAVWVSYMDLNMKGTDYSEKAFKEKFDNIVKNCKRLKINSLVVHVRPFSDALYPSKYFPWSHIVLKEQGQNPGYDPLKYMVKRAHKDGMQFHAWINPFRTQLNNIPKKIGDSSPFAKFKTIQSKILNEYFVDFGSSKYLNPASSDIRELIINGVKEIVENYDVDGIHFDDYFYPEVEKGSENFDEESYKEYTKNLKKEDKLLTHKAWRIKNVNKLIRDVYKEIKLINPNVVFGISPCGNIDANEKIGADIKTWCKNKGYVDYLCPQIYFSLNHPTLPFKTCADSWLSLPKDPSIKLYCGLGAYKAGKKDYDKGTWKDSEDILRTQVEYTRGKFNGYMVFDYQSLVSKECKKEVENLLKIF